MRSRARAKRGLSLPAGGEKAQNVSAEASAVMCTGEEGDREWKMLQDQGIRGLDMVKIYWSEDYRISEIKE